MIVALVKVDKKVWEALTFLSYVLAFLGFVGIILTQQKIIAEPFIVDDRAEIAERLAFIQHMNDNTVTLYSSDERKYSDTAVSAELGAARQYFEGAKKILDDGPTGAWKSLIGGPSPLDAFAGPQAGDTPLVVNIHRGIESDFDNLQGSLKEVMTYVNRIAKLSKLTGGSRDFNITYALFYPYFFAFALAVATAKAFAGTLGFRPEAADPRPT
jgi:hypothetical protein